MGSQGGIRSPIVPLAAASLLILSACRQADPGVSSAPPGRPPDTLAAAPWSIAGAEDQPQMRVLIERTPSTTGYMPGTTPWRPLDALIQPDGSPPTAGAFLTALVLANGWADPLGESAWEQTTRVWSAGDDEAVGVILLWGFLDDAVAGRDVRVRLRRSNGSWRAELAEERFHCARGVGADGVCS